MKNQSGMTFLGFILVAAIGLSIVFAGIKIVPAYIEFFSVKKIMQRIADDPNFDSKSKQEIMAEFDKGADAGYVTVIHGKDLLFAKDAEGKQIVSAEYQVVTPLAFNLSALMDFKAATGK